MKFLIERHNPNTEQEKIKRYLLKKKLQVEEINNKILFENKNFTSALLLMRKDLFGYITRGEILIHKDKIEIELDLSLFNKFSVFSSILFLSVVLLIKRTQLGPRFIIICLMFFSVFIFLSYCLQMLLYKKLFIRAFEKALCSE